MNQPQHTSPFAMNRALSKPWPTRTACNATLAHYGVTIQSDDQFLIELTKLEGSHTGWILLIAPPGRPTIRHLEEQGIDPNRVLVVHSPKIKNWQQTLERSLGNGHCAAVFTWLPEQIELDHAKLQRLGQQSGVFTRFFGAKRTNPGAPLLAYAEQDIYLNH
ncbi:cell division inhibitor [Aeromonas australiensis]|uniref:cell division inhibitor n=1 Tax=Aeromonas australiensis TaxID=1114880 RepID=UPI00058A53DE|nr:cell division inhibitor [Aeromonas australiensis]MCF3098076.1 cell division inhibitor [Aeromonas australiensis]